MTEATSSDAQIFISIASYRDQYLPFTINSALSQATHPERLTFGICWQADEDENLDPFLNDPRFRIRKYPYHASLGYGCPRGQFSHSDNFDCPFHPRIARHGSPKWLAVLIN